MLAQVTSTMTNNLMHAQLAAVRASGLPMVSLLPRLERRVGLFDTAAMPYLVEAGRRATEEALPAIHAMLARTPRLAVA
jgi:NTE family protein